MIRDCKRRKRYCLGFAVIQRLLVRYWAWFAPCSHQPILSLVVNDYSPKHSTNLWCQWDYLALGRVAFSLISNLLDIRDSTLGCLWWTSCISQWETADWEAPATGCCMLFYAAYTVSLAQTSPIFLFPPIFGQPADDVDRPPIFVTFDHADICEISCL